MSDLGRYKYVHLTRACGCVNVDVLTVSTVRVGVGVLVRVLPTLSEYWTDAHWGPVAGGRLQGSVQTGVIGPRCHMLCTVSRSCLRSKVPWSGQAH